MPLSRYLKIYPAPNHPDSWLIYSTKKGSLVRLSARQLNAARDETLAETDRDTLRRLELWTDDLVTERAAMAAIVDRTNADSRQFKATVVLTLDCNLACPYCFEDLFRGNYAMDDATVRLLVAYIEREQIAKGRDVEIRFYGGEPLLAVPQLQAIARPLQQAAVAAGVQFSCSLVTNATLMTRPVVAELLPLGLSSAQITLDGPAEIHNQQRPFVSGQGSFATIVANIRQVCDLITIKPGGNFTHENYREFPAMLDALLTAGINPACLGPVQFAPILPKSGVRAGHDACGFSNSEPWVIDATLYLRQETLRRGFAVLQPTMGICMVEMDNHVVVNYDGTLYKCPAFMGWPELSVGTLATGVQDYTASHHLKHWQNDACLDCAYLPLCFGGCRLLPLLQTGTISTIDCRRDFYDATLEEMIRQEQLHRQL